MPSIAVPRVTIGVPVFNSERYLPSALESLINQTYSDIEIIICDNASTDSTPNIAKSYAIRDDRIRYVRNPVNVGAGRNFTRCTELARGELFRWASADDISAPTFVEQCVVVLDTHPDVIQAFPRAALIDENGVKIADHVEKIATLADDPCERYVHVMNSLGLVNAIYGVIRLDHLRRTLLHGSYHGADEVLQAEIALYGKLFEIPELLFFRRMHPAAHSGMSLTERAAHYNPSLRSRPGLVRSRLAIERLRSVRRSSLSGLQKLRVSVAILRNAVSRRDEFMREWRRALRERAALRSMAPSSRREVEGTNVTTEPS